MQDKNLIQKIANGDVFAFKQLFEQYKNSVFNLCYRFTKSKEEAEDLCQDVFLKIFNSAKSFREQAQPSTWIYRITVNLCLNYNRRKNRFAWLSVSELFSNATNLQDQINCQEDCPHEQLEQKEREKIVQQVIQTLPEKQRVALILQRYAGFSVKTIAQIMNCSELSVQSRLARARENLAKKLLPFAKEL